MGYTTFSDTPKSWPVVSLSFWPREGNPFFPPRRHKNGGQEMLIQKFLAGIANMAAFSREAKRSDPERSGAIRFAPEKMVKHRG